MAKQLRRVNVRDDDDDLRDLRAECSRLAALNDSLCEQLAAAQAEIESLRDQLGYERKLAARPGLTVNNRAVVTPTEAARILEVKLYQVSRWMQHFECVAVPGRARPLIYADSLHIPSSAKRRTRR